MYCRCEEQKEVSFCSKQQLSQLQYLIQMSFTHFLQLIKYWESFLPEAKAIA